MNAHDKREKFTALLAGDRCVIAGSVFDPLSARIADEVGFEVGLLGARSRRSRCSARRT